jgi:hypothetical protein
MMTAMRAVVLAMLLAACSFEHYEPYGTSGDDGGTGSGSGDANMGMPGIDASGCAWSDTPTNFDPCMLPAPATLTVSGNVFLDTASTTLPKKLIAQNDGTTITVVHLSQLTVNQFSSLIITGSGVVLAVDGAVTINGTIVAVGGEGNETHCATAKGSTGADSQTAAGAGGGGGAAAAENGGTAGSGDGTGAGAGGTRGSKVSTTFSPLRGGCRGGNGGRYNGAGTAPVGGRGGGAIQISTNTKISIAGGAAIDAAGRGGGGGSGAHVGGGGGGSGGSIFLEGPQMSFGFASLACADGGSGGEGGGATVGGNDGRTGRCNSLQAAETPNTMNSAGGDGGPGGYALSKPGGPGVSSTTSAGAGGGGGGSVGWIRIKSPNISNDGLVTTPQASN